MGERLSITSARLDGWTPYIRMTERFGGPPPRQALCRFWDEVTGHMWTGRAADMHPLSNVAYVWWTFTGIERKKLERKEAQ